MTLRFQTTRGVIAIAAISTLLSGCAQTPLGPTVQVMPGPGKSFDAFQADNTQCKGFAAGQVQGQAEASNQRAVGAAALATVLGAGLGAAVGAPWGSAGQGAGIGAAGGAATGAAIGADMSSNDQVNIQVQYDNAFSQCMYAKGEMVPGYAPPAPTPAVASYSGPDHSLVRAVQSELVRLSYLQDTPDGVAGAHTRAAIHAYQTANGLPPDGTISPGLLAHLQATPTNQTATAKSPANWVAPAGATPASATAGGTPSATPAVATGPAAPAGWVAPAKSP